MELIILLCHFFFCAFMTGLIWLIQRVHYPSFAYVQDNKFAEFSHFHTKSISQIVMPMMILEIASAFILVSYRPSSIFILNAFLNILIFVSTFSFSVPLHQKLVHGKNDFYITRLVKTNWYRTILWSIRSLMLLVYLITTEGLSHPSF